MARCTRVNGNCRTHSAGASPPVPSPSGRGLGRGRKHAESQGVKSSSVVQAALPHLIPLPLGEEVSHAASGAKGRGRWGGAGMPSRPSIPKGLRPSAQGWPVGRAYPGNNAKKISAALKGLHPLRACRPSRNWIQPLQGWKIITPMTQGSASDAQPWAGGGNPFRIVPADGPTTRHSSRLRHIWQVSPSESGAEATALQTLDE